MKDKNGNNIELRGWVQHGSTRATEISQLEIYVGSVKTRIDLNMSCDEMVEWCKAHNLDVTDMREKDAA